MHGKTKQLLIIRMEKPLSEMRKPTGKISSHSYFLPGYSTPLGNKPKSAYIIHTCTTDPNLAVDDGQTKTNTEFSVGPNEVIKLVDTP